MNSTMKTILALVTIVGSVFTGYLFLDARFAKCADVKAVERRLDYKIENDKLMGMRSRQWQLQDKYPDASKAPQETQQQMKEIGADLEMQKEKVKKMEVQ
jgi:hypothetical protein